ncbi:MULTISPECIES: DUF7848 domain-containing protein [Streptomyces]|uniref:DUF7848 domain-containing protein n=1 Tax=Streptomyces TaxID=1883 RepID=UPI001106F232
MVGRAVYRYTDWSLATDTTASGPIYAAECTSCGEASAAADEQEGPEVWCLRHAGLTGHTGFRGVITSFFRASLVEGPR